MRLTLIILAECKFSLVWTFHHIILEGWSAAIILNEFWKRYGDRARIDLPLQPANVFRHRANRRQIGRSMRAQVTVALPKLVQNIAADQPSRMM